MKAGFLIIALCVFTTTVVTAQYFQFSQYNFAQQRINPASVGSSDYASASGLFRNQSTGAAFHLKSNILNLAYPLINRSSGFRWSGIGLSFMNDGTGQSGIYRTQEVSLSYAINVPVARHQTLSVGLKVLHANRKVDTNGLYTDSQYIPDRGFDPGMESGEPAGLLNSKFNTFSTGLYWQQEDKQGNKIATLGLSFFDLNKPTDSFWSGDNPYPSTLVLSGSARVVQQDKLAVSPDVLVTLNSGVNLFTVGAVTSYSINTYRDRPDDRIDIITRYTLYRSAILGLQLHQENFSVGFSYDFPVASKVANAGAFEVGVEFRRLVNPKAKNRNRKTSARKPADRNKKTPVRTTSTQTKVNNVKPKPVAKDSAASVKPTTGASEMAKRLKQKQDSVAAIAKTGMLKQEPLLLEEATLRFGFDFASSEMDESTSKYLDDLAEALNDSPDLKIELTGHTDNVGSAKFNQKLSIERAATIRDELIKRGVSEQRISVSGKGLTEPLNDNTTAEKRAENRRVEMKIFYE